MLDQPSSTAVEQSLNPEWQVERSLSGSFCLDAVPATMASMLGAGPSTALAERLAGLAPPRSELLLVILDGFGWNLLERYANSSPLLRRLFDEGVVCKLQAQFPTTTAANITTLHSGLPVGHTGLFEWIMYEPAVEALVFPLMFSYAGDRSRDTLRTVVTNPRTVLPLPSHYQTLTDRGIECVVHQSAAFTPSTFSSVVLKGARLVPYRDAREVGHNVAAAPTVNGSRYTVVYLNQADAVAHLQGPSSKAYGKTVAALLDVLENLFTALAPGTLFVLTADHGHVDVDPTRTIYLNRLWPKLESHLRRWPAGPALGPGGSPRDCFLYLADPAETEPVRAQLAGLLAGVADVRTTADIAATGLFGPDVTDRLLDRAGDLVVLPVPGETVWWDEPVSFENFFLGHHGGLSQDEAVIPFAAAVR